MVRTEDLLTVHTDRSGTDPDRVRVRARVVRVLRCRDADLWTENPVRAESFLIRKIPWARALAIKTRMRIQGSSFLQSVLQNPVTDK